MKLVAGCIAIVASLIIPSGVQADGKGAADYWKVIDRTTAGYLNSLWNSSQERYLDELQVPAIGVNANLLELAAIQSRFGRATAEAKRRARLILGDLTAPPTFEMAGSQPAEFTGSNWRQYGWHDVLGDATSTMHESIDGAATEALWYAWKYRSQLGLDAGQVAAIVNVLDLHAQNVLTKVPIQDNQSSMYWYVADLRYAYEVTGKTTYRDAWSTLMHNAVDFMGPELYPGAITPWLWPDYTWNYRPDFQQIHVNFFSTAYANNMFQGFRAYPSMVAAGGQPFSETEFARLRAFEQHVLGDWQTNGQFNWDESHGVERQFLLGAWVTGLPALTTIATVPATQARADDGRVARGLLDRALDQFSSMDRWNNDPADGAVSPNFYGTQPSNPAFLTKTFNADFVKNIAQALDEGILGVQARAVDSNWRFNWDRQRLTVSTDSYSTAIIPRTTNETNAAYGGFELARLFSAAGLPLTNLGGDGGAAHAFELRDNLSSLAMTSQFASDPAGRPLAPAGQRSFNIATSFDSDLNGTSPYSSKVFQRRLGPGDWITARGSGQRNGYRLDVRYTFLHDEISLRESYRHVSGARLNGTVTKRIPLYDSASVRVSAKLTTGKIIHLWDGVHAARPVPAESIVWIHVKRSGRGVVVTPGRLAGMVDAKLRIGAQTPGEGISPRSSRSLEWFTPLAQINQAEFTAVYRFTNGTDTVADAMAKRGRRSSVIQNPFGGTVAVGDIDGNGFNERILGSRSASPPTVALYTTAGALIRSFQPFGSDTQGVSVAAGDLDGDGDDEIVVGSGSSGQVRVFTGTGRLLRTLTAYDPAPGGVNVGAGDLDGDGDDEIVVTERQRARTVRVFNSRGIRQANFRVFPIDISGGVSLAVGDMDGDGVEDIVVAPGAGGGPQVRWFSGTGNLRRQFFVGPTSLRSGVMIGFGDPDGDGRDDLIIRTSASGKRYVTKTRRLHPVNLPPGYFAYLKQ